MATGVHSEVSGGVAGGAGVRWPPCCQQRPPPRTSRLQREPFFVRPPHGAGGSTGFGASAWFGGTRARLNTGDVDAGSPVRVGPATRPRVKALAATDVRTSAATSHGRGLAMDRQPRHRGPPMRARLRSVSCSPQSQQKRVRLGTRRGGSLMSHDRDRPLKVASGTPIVDSRPALADYGHAAPAPNPSAR